MLITLKTLKSTDPHTGPSRAKQSESQARSEE